MTGKSETGAALLNDIMHDGSRNFALIPQARNQLYVIWSIIRMRGARLTGVVPSIDEWWIDFRYKGQRFSINDQFGDYWFFASDPNCPEAILNELAEYFSKRLR